MSQTKILSLLVGAGIALGSAGTASAEATQSDEIRALVAEMMADANTRSSLLQSGGNAGHDGKFFMASSDGNFRLNVGGQMQFRYIANFGDDNNTTDGDDFTGGFQARRTKLTFSGNVISKDIFFKINGAFDRDGNPSFGLEDAYVGYKFGNGWEMKWGQFKAPFLREELVSSSRQLAAERSLTNELFTGNRTQGIELSYKAEDWRMMFSFNDGFNAANTDFNQDTQGFGTPVVYTPTNGGGGEADYGFTGRAEFKLNGEWKQFKDFTSMPGSEYGLLLGVAAHYESNETTGGFGGAPADVNNFLYTVDVSVEGDGWNFFAAFIGASTDFDGLADIAPADGAGDDADFDDFGLVVQAGMFIPDTDWEAFIRYDAIFPDDDRAQDDTFSMLTFGLNWYWSGHAAKLTLDAVLALDESTGGSGNPLAFSAYSDALGLVGNNDDTEAVFRAQFQLLF